MRVRDFPQKPSRLDVAFCCPSIETVRFYRDKHDVGALDYRVELVDPSKLHHLADHDLCISGFVGMTQMEQIARRYWSGEIVTAPELLTLSPLRILERLDA